MYITRVEIQNIRSIKHLVWEIDAADAPGWHVILGDNGSGKSTFVRSIALVLVGPTDIFALRENYNEWIEVGEATGLAKCGLYFDKKSDKFPADCKPSQQFILLLSRFDPIPLVVATPEYYYEHKNNWSSFSASYGPYRKFSGGYQEDEKLFDTHKYLARHLTVFTETVSLADSLLWLQQSRFEELEGKNEASLLLANVTIFVNQGDFLPFGARLEEIKSAGVTFRDGNGNRIFVEEMSDGYRSVLSLTFELLRQLSIAYGPDIFETHDDGKVTVKVPGVVQIDEVDAHLHPTWQKRIGFWFREHFPQMQFIVTTHSPLVCQAAEKGSIFLLPRPGTDETGRMLEGAERDRLLYGDITDAYSTEAFGGGDTRSPKGQEMLNRLGELNVKEMLQGLGKEEMQEQERLRAAMPASASQVI